MSPTSTNQQDGTMPVDATVRQEDATALEALAALQSEAFMDEPVAMWVFPDEDMRRQFQPFVYSQLLGAAFAKGDVLSAGDRAGLSVWLRLDAGEYPMEGADDPEAMPEGGIPPEMMEVAARGGTLQEAIRQRHPVDVPHLYLAASGVLPAQRGRGLGSAMLRHRLAQADADGMPAYVEASSPRNRALYQRHGFEPVGAPIVVPDGPELYPMWRPASR